MSTNNGIKAFPVLHSIDGNWVREPIEEYQGMTLRDYFAAKAMQALLNADPDRIHKYISVEAYCMADEMIAAREAG